MELTTIATVAAIMASAVGAFLAVDQLTSAARQRRFAEFLRAAADAEPDGSQREVLSSLRRETVARLVGASAVPVWAMAGDIGMLAIVTFNAAGFTRSGLATPPQDAAGWWGVIWPSLAMCAGTWMFGRRLVRLLDERRRISDDFLVGKVPLSPRLGILLVMEGGTRYEFVLGAWLALGATALGFGIGAWLASPAFPVLGFFVALAGWILLLRAASDIRVYLARRQGALWKHPRDLGTSVSVAKATTSSASGQAEPPASADPK